jgi:hypothetical protein
MGQAKVNNRIIEEYLALMATIGDEFAKEEIRQ